jgi:diguanylate cyclase (GGDEF)-like protein
MIGDIDHFKQINDRFSHATGDEVLRKVAGIFQSNTRKNDLVARYGGEEFVIAFPETPLEQAVNLCERLREFISNHTWHEINPDLRVTMSMGLNSDLNLDNFEQMLAVADDKLYEAKNAGRNRVCY